MRKTIKIIFIALAVFVMVAQLVRPDLSNPPVNPNERLEASVEVPSDVAAILRRSCSDCHTNETVHPWYSKITPVNWWLKSHFEHGREHLNLSTWAKYTPQQKEKRLEEICEVLESAEMPLPSYLWGHRDAMLTPEDSKLLCSWATSVRMSLNVVSQ
ncbi:MAG: heme-binding domain-containing protein [Pyrinomonadaceae bacterium]